MTWLITGFVTRLTRRVPHVVQKLLTLPGHPRSPPVFSGIRVARFFVFCIMFLRLLFVLLSCLSFNLRFRLYSWYLQIFLEVVSQYIHLLFEETWVPGDPQIIDKPPPNITYTVCVESTSGQLFLESNSLLTWLASYKVQKLLVLREHLNSPPHFWRGPCFTSFTFSVLWCVVLYCIVLCFVCFVCLFPVSCESNVSGFFILD